MNEDDPKLEARLARLQPTEVPGHLLARLQAARPRAAHQPRPEPHWLLRWLLPAGVVAAGVAIGAFAVRTSHHAVEKAAPLAQAVPTAGRMQTFTANEVEAVLLDARDLGTFTSTGQQPIRLVECTWLDHETYRGDDGASQLRVLQARQEIIPVALPFH
jgi:anti-sigma factor RsiW